MGKVGKVGAVGVEVPEDEEDEEDQGNKTMAMQIAEKLLKSVSHARPLTHLQGELLKYVSCQIQNTMDLVGVLIREGQPPPQPGSKGRQGKRSAAAMEEKVGAEDGLAARAASTPISSEPTSKSHAAQGASEAAQLHEIKKKKKKKKEEAAEEQRAAATQAQKEERTRADEEKKAKAVEDKKAKGAAEMENPELFQSAALKLEMFRFDLEEACLFSGDDYLTPEELKQLAIRAKVRFAPKSSRAALKKSLRDVDFEKLVREDKRP